MKAFVVEKYGKDGLRAAEVPEPTVGTTRRPGPSARREHQPAGQDGPQRRVQAAPQVQAARSCWATTWPASSPGRRRRPRLQGRRRGLRPSARPPDRDLRGVHRDRRRTTSRSSRPPSPSRRRPPYRWSPWPPGRSWSTAPTCKPGQKVLVHAGAGGLGSTVIQLAKHLGATVATTTEHRDRGLGQRASGPTSSSTTPSRTSPRSLSGYDVVLDSLGGQNLEKSLTVLKPGGLAISVVGPPDAGFARQLGAPADPGPGHERCSAARSAGRRRRCGVRYEFFFMQANGSQLRELGALYDAGKLRPVIDSDLPVRADNRGDGVRRAGPHQGRQGRRHDAFCSRCRVVRGLTTRRTYRRRLLRGSARDGVDSSRVGFH